MINWKWFTQNGEEKVDNLTEGHQYIDYSRKMDKRIFPEQRDKKKRKMELTSMKSPSKSFLKWHIINNLTFSITSNHINIKECAASFPWINQPQLNWWFILNQKLFFFCLAIPNEKKKQQLFIALENAEWGRRTYIKNRVAKLDKTLQTNW